MAGVSASRWSRRRCPRTSGRSNDATSHGARSPRCGATTCAAPTGTTSPSSWRSRDGSSTRHGPGRNCSPRPPTPVTWRTGGCMPPPRWRPTVPAGRGPYSPRPGRHSRTATTSRRCGARRPSGSSSPGNCPRATPTSWPWCGYSPPTRPATPRSCTPSPSTTTALPRAARTSTVPSPASALMPTLPPTTRFSSYTPGRTLIVAPSPALASAAPIVGNPHLRRLSTLPGSSSRHLRRQSGQGTEPGACRRSDEPGRLRARPVLDAAPQ